MAFISWTEIQAFHNIRKYAKTKPELFEKTISYKTKVKLHGTNAAVQMIPNFGVGPGPGNIAEQPLYFQSREGMITPQKDNAGFARWASEAFKERQKTYGGPGVVIYGEWIGPGIQKNVAVSEIPKKCFAVFAARPLFPSYIPNQLIVEPERLKDLIKDVPDTYVLPWYASDSTELKFDINWNSSIEELSVLTDKINKEVLAVEQNDPWVEVNFGVKGTGEGLVFYPVSEDHFGYENFKNLVFKAKGEKHKNIKNSAPAQVDASVAVNIDQFVDMVLTEARLEQGIQATDASSFDTKFIGKFIVWVQTDVKKETQAELAASSLTWEQVQKTIMNKARDWYITKFKSK